MSHKPYEKGYPIRRKDFGATPLTTLHDGKIVTATIEVSLQNVIHL